jgi:hypothetical protein
VEYWSKVSSPNAGQSHQNNQGSCCVSFRHVLYISKVKCGACMYYILYRYRWPKEFKDNFLPYRGFSRAVKEQMFSVFCEVVTNNACWRINNLEIVQNRFVRYGPAYTCKGRKG